MLATRRRPHHSVVTRPRYGKDAAAPTGVFSKLYATNTAAICYKTWIVFRTESVELRDSVCYSDDYRLERSLMSLGQTLMSEGMEAKDRLVEEIVLLALYLVSTAANSLALLVFCRRPGLRTISNR